MENEIRAWLADIKQAIVEINSFLPEKRDFAVFKDDIKTKRAVERNIEIIGEALARILKKDPSFNITNARRIVDTRNRIIHGYDTVSDDILWAIICRELPVLESEIDSKLNNA